MYVCMYVYTNTQAIIADLSFSNISNCCHYQLIQTVNYSKPSQPLHPPFCLHKIRSNKPSQMIHPPFCAQKLTSRKISQPLQPLSCLHTVNSSKASQLLIPPSCPHTSQQIYTTSVSDIPCKFTNQQWHKQCSSFLSCQHRLIPKWSAFHSPKYNTIYKQLSSVPFNPCSWIREAVKKITNNLCKYTVGSNNYVNVISNRKLWFQWLT